MAKSIMQKDKFCFLCGRNGAMDALEEHHVFGGPSRKHSESDGLKVWLCGDRCHRNGKHSAHKDKQYFLPRKTSGTEYLNTGYISSQKAGPDGSFLENPKLQINLEARYKCFGLTLQFGRNCPSKMILHAYLFDELMEDYLISDLSELTVINHEFQEFNKLVIEFTEGVPYSHVILDNITFGESTDYKLRYREELAKTPKGTQLSKARELQVIRTLYAPSDEIAELTRETITVSAADNRYTFYFSNASYDLSCELTDAQEGQTAKIVESSNYYATIELSGVSGACEVVITGREYTVTKAKVSRQLNVTGDLVSWENPLVSTAEHGIDMADWVGDYLKADREYELPYRGDPRIDANDLLFLENKYVPDLMLRVYDHTLKFTGALSGTIKARREMR